MKITFLGTAAAEAVPTPYCACANCEEARQVGGKSIRARSSVLIDDQILIDPGPDVMIATARLGMSLAEVPYMLQTHPHDDHQDFLMFAARQVHWGGSIRRDIDYFVNRKGIERLAKRVAEERSAASLESDEGQANFRLKLHEIRAWEEIEVGPYRVLPVNAFHDDRVDPLLMAIQGPNGTRLFYGTDTGRIPEGTWERLANLGWWFDLIVMDHTMGFSDMRGGHLNAAGFQEEMRLALESGAATDETRFMATHMAHRHHPSHEKTGVLMAEHGYVPAWDGLELDAATGEERDLRRF